MTNVSSNRPKEIGYTDVLGFPMMLHSLSNLLKLTLLSPAQLVSVTGPTLVSVMSSKSAKPFNRIRRAV